MDLFHTQLMHVINHGHKCLNVNNFWHIHINKQDE